MNPANHYAASASGDYSAAGTPTNTTAFARGSNNYSPEYGAFGAVMADVLRIIGTASVGISASAQMGGELAGPVFRQVMTYALQARQVAPITPASSG